MLGVVVPFGVLPTDDSRVINTVNETEPALTDSAEMGQATAASPGTARTDEPLWQHVLELRRHLPTAGRGWSATTWLSQYYLGAPTRRPGRRTRTRRSLHGLDLSYLGNVGIGAEQVDERRDKTGFAHQAAWGNG